MRAGQQGPQHTVDTEQVWTLLDGALTAEIGDETLEAGRGDTLVLPPDLQRRITAHAETGVTAIVVAPAGMRARAPRVAVGPGCATPDGDALIPAWVI
jgi:quercetin dioxygenase-like cupin family protein